MFNSIDGDTTIWLAGLAAMLLLGAAIPLARFVVRRRMRKKGWSASHDPITIDFTGLAGVGSLRQARAATGDRTSVRTVKLP
jgi:hypothetical protein